MPNTISHTAQATPALRDAQRVRAMTPLFWLNVVLGMLVQSAEMKLEMPSPRRPPRILWPGRGGGGGGGAQFVHGHSRMTIDPRIPSTPGRSTSGFTNQAEGVCDSG